MRQQAATALPERTRLEQEFARAPESSRALASRSSGYDIDRMRKTYHGTCHCGAIAFEADIDLSTGIRKCNCSFCLKLGYRKSLVPYAALRITRGLELMQDYQPEPSSWPPGHVNHYWCPRCGAHPFSRGYLEKEMGGDFWAINVSCLDDATEQELGSAPIIYEDGKRDHQERAPEITSYL